MATAQKLYTAEEFFHLPDPIHGGKMELVCGKVVVVAPFGRPQSKLTGRIVRSLSAFVEPLRIGELHIELGYILARNPDVVLAPDVSFIDNRAQAAAGEWERFFEGPPTLAVEVTSPTDREPEIARKVRDYLAAGASRVWVVRPDRATVTVHRPGRDARILAADGTLTSDDAGFETPGFTLSLSQLFA
jgi:Uma2 family endonuclease